MDFFKLFVLAAPFISAGLASYLTYVSSTKAKRKEYLYQNRIEGFKEIATNIAELKRYCLGNIALNQGNEFAPFYDETGSGLMYRTAIAHAADFNQIFLTNISQKSISELLDQMSFICNFELLKSTNPDEFSDISVYNATLKQAESCLSTLYKELGLD